MRNSCLALFTLVIALAGCASQDAPPERTLRFNPDKTCDLVVSDMSDSGQQMTHIAHATKCENQDLTAKPNVVLTTENCGIVTCAAYAAVPNTGICQPPSDIPFHCEIPPAAWDKTWAVDKH